MGAAPSPLSMPFTGHNDPRRFTEGGTAVEQAEEDEEEGVAVEDGDGEDEGAAVEEDEEDEEEGVAVVFFFFFRGMRLCVLLMPTAPPTEVDDLVLDFLSMLVSTQKQEIRRGGNRSKRPRRLGTGLMCSPSFLPSPSDC